MNEIDRHVFNRIGSPSQDTHFCNWVRRLMGLLDNSGATETYACIGSCAVQSYLPFVFRLPNDVDLVLPMQSEAAFREAALRDELGYKQELGRFSIGLGDFRAQVIPERMNIVDNVEGAIFESFDFSRYSHLVSERQLNLLGTSDSVRIRTHCLEVLLFIEWLRPPYTGSIYSTFFLFLAGQPEHGRLREILTDNKNLAPIVLAQLSRYVDLVLHVPFFDSEREQVSRRIRVLAGQLA